MHTNYSNCEIKISTIFVIFVELHTQKANALYVLAIIASGEESFINSILNKNGLTLFKNYAFLPI